MRDLQDETLIELHNKVCDTISREVYNQAWMGIGRDLFWNFRSLRDGVFEVVKDDG